MSKTIMEQALELVAKGKTFKIDFKNKSLKVGKKYFIKDGKYVGELGIIPEVKDVWIRNIETYYNRFNDSIPVRGSRKQTSKYFYIATKEKPAEDMCFGEYRPQSQFMLEFYILAHLLDGSMKWTEELNTPGWRSKTFFWQCEDVPSLIIRKDWF